MENRIKKKSKKYEEENPRWWNNFTLDFLTGTWVKEVSKKRVHQKILT